MIKTIEDMQAAMKKVGRWENDENKLAAYLRVQQSGLPVREENDMSGVVTVFASVLDLFTAWPAADVTGFELNPCGCWDVFISD